MALVKCRECAKEISSEAAACPHCGASKKKKSGFLKNTVIGVLGLFAVLIVIGSMSDPKAGSGTQAVVAGPAAGPAYAFKTTPSELASAYEANTVAADSKFKGQKYMVEGTVDSINTGIGDGVYLTMRGGNPFMEPQFSLEDSEKAAAGALSKGQKVTLICTGGGDIAKIPMSRRCKFTT